MNGSPRRLALSALSALLCAAHLVVFTAPSQAAAPSKRPDYRIAVMDFAPAADGEALASLGKGLASMLTTDLTGVQGFELIERARLEDVVGELELGKSGLVDAKTAAKLGKLVAASHLVVGTFTVVGGTMRIDARLVSVKDGKVALTAQIEGEKDAFFELEKGLVRRLVGALGVELAPKERAALARIHTADFEAFRDYSKGIDAFDRKDYDAAVAALQAATKRDSEFQLAALTLGEYERIIGELRTRAETIGQAREEAERLKKLAARSAEAAFVQRMFEVAGKTGKADQRPRLAVLHALAVAYLNLGSNLGKLSKLRQAEDRFTMERTGEGLAARYFAEARGLFPDVPACLDEDFFARLPDPRREPDADKAWDKWLAWQVKKVWGDPKDHPQNRTNDLVNNARSHNVRTMARVLHLDRVAAMQLQDDLWAAVKAGAGDFTTNEMEEHLAEGWRGVLDLDRSTGYWRQQAAHTTREHKLKQIADEIELNRDIAKALSATTTLRPWLEEMLALLGTKHWIWRKHGARAFAGDTLSADVLRELNRDRKLDAYSFSGSRGRDEPALIGDHPVWLVQTGGGVVTGRRGVDGRSDELRSYQEKVEEGRLAFLVVDGVLKDSFTMSFRVGYRPAADWWPLHGVPREAKTLADIDLVDGRPTVAVAFGIRDIDVAKQERKGEDERVVTRPLGFYAVILGEDRVRLVRAVESGRVTFGRKAGFVTETLGEARLSGAQQDGARISVTVDADATRVKVGGSSAKLPAIADTGARTGFYGFWLDGAGYVSVGDLTVK